MHSAKSDGNTGLDSVANEDHVSILTTALRGAAAVVCVALIPALAGAQMYLVDSLNELATDFYRVKPSTGQMRLMGTLPGSLGEAAGLAASSADVLYVSTLRGNIVRIDLSPTYRATVLGNVGGALALLEMDGGSLLGVDEDTDELVRITLAPLAKQVIGTLRTGGPQGPVVDVIGGDLARTAAGRIYMFTNSTTRSNSNGKLYLVDPTTAVATLIGPRDWGYGRITGLSFDPADATLYATGRDIDRLLVVSPISGMVTRATGLCRSCTVRYDIAAGDLAFAPLPTRTPTPMFRPTATPTRRP